MPVEVNTLPQQIEPVVTTSFADVVAVLPERLTYPLNVWIAGRLARYGRSTDALVFLVEQDEETSTELKLYFEQIAGPYQATVSHDWRDERVAAVRLYNDGRLIIDKHTLAYTELPTATRTAPVLTVADVLARLPKMIEWPHTVYLAGGLVRNGWSCNDVDFMVDNADTAVYAAMRKFFGDALGCKVDVGNAAMPEREPVYKFKIYEGGKCLL